MYTGAKRTSVSMCVCVCVCVFGCDFFYLSIYQFICLSTDLKDSYHVRMYVCINTNISTYLYIKLSTYPSIYE